MSTPPKPREITRARTGSRPLRSRGSDGLLPNAKPGPTGKRQCGLLDRWTCICIFNITTINTDLCGGVQLIGKAYRLPLSRRWTSSTMRHDERRRDGVT